MSAEFTPNIFIQNLSDICRQHLLDEKYLLAPSRRVGSQWVEQVARAGQPAVNLRVLTLPGLVLEMTGPLPGRLLSRRGAEILVSRILDDLRRKGQRYFTTLEPYPALVKALGRTVGELRSAGVTPAELETGKRGGGEAEKSQNLKMAELADLLAEYEEGLNAGGFTDYAGLLAAVITRLEAEEKPWPDGRILLIPDDADPGGPEGRLLDLLPSRIVEGLGPALSTSSVTLTDRQRMAWLHAPMEAPAAVGDGTLTIMAASGEVNEVRAALRRCLAEGRALDRVEILYTDRDSYLPLLFEVLLSHFDVQPGSLETLPATFADGIPVRYSRPGRALAAWVYWAVEGYPASGLAGMIREGLLTMNGGEKPDDRAAGADLLTELSPPPGPDAILGAVERALSSLEEPGTVVSRDENGEELPSGSLKLEPLKVLQSLGRMLKKCTPPTGAGLPELLDSAIGFLEGCARTAGEMDEYARTALLKEIGEAKRHIDDLGHAPSGDPHEWLISLMDDVRVAGSGPRPGGVHIASLTDGGHSGRPHTMVLGLDDGRFPGQDRPEPVLLDHERRDLSEALRLAGEYPRLGEEKLSALAVRGGETLTLSCSLADLVQDRGAFPSPSLVKAYRILSDPEADQDALTRHLLPAAGFIDPGSRVYLDAAEWWIDVFTAPESSRDAPGLFYGRYEHLNRGAAAAEGRGNRAATPFDGVVGSLPPDMDILSESGPAVSASRLQALGTCPLRYFYRYVLGIERVDEEPLPPGQWLSPMDRGNVLHRLFQVYVDRLIKAGLRPDTSRDGSELDRLLEELLAGFENTAPSPSGHVREHEKALLSEAARIFLRSEEEFTANHEPLWAEASIGLPPTDIPTELDHPEPVLIDLGQGRKLRVRGRIDRIDRRQEDGAFVVTDYKTGSSWLYTRKDPFHQGRVVQHLLYLLMAEARIKETRALPPPVSAFRFLFPTARAQGEDVLLTREVLEEGMGVLQDLCDLARTGCFVPTDSVGDCGYCDYVLVCGDVEGQAVRMAAKLEGDDKRLDPLRRLRGYD